MNRNFNFYGTLVLLAIFVGVLVGVGAYKYNGSSSVSLLSCEDSGFGKKCEVPSIDPAMVALQDAVLRDPAAKYDAPTGDTYHGWQTFGGKLSITVSKGKYTLLTVRDNQSRYITMVEIGMDGKVVYGAGRSFDESELSDRQYVAPTAGSAGEGEQYREHYEKLAEKIKPAFFHYFGVDPTGNKFGI